MRRGSPRRAVFRTTASAVPVSLLVGAIACGLASCGDQASASGPGPGAGVTTTPSAFTSTATTSSPTSSTAAATSTPAPTATTTTRSPLEDTPEVRLTRQFAAEAARAVNDRNMARPQFLALVTKASQSSIQDIGKEEVAARRRYAGPLPFTPVRVQPGTATAKVYACVVMAGFGVDPQGKREPYEVQPSLFTLVKEGGAWKVDGFLDDDSGLSCRGVNPPLETW